MSGRATPSAWSNASRPKPTSMVMDTAHDRTERLNQSITATREINPPWSRIDVMSVLQTWFTRVMGTPRSTYGETRGVGGPDSGVVWDRSPRSPSSAATAPPVCGSRGRLDSVTRPSSDARHHTACPYMAYPATASKSDALRSPPAPDSNRLSEAARPGHIAAQY